MSEVEGITSRMEGLSTDTRDSQIQEAHDYLFSHLHYDRLVGISKQSTDTNLEARVKEAISQHAYKFLTSKGAPVTIASAVRLMAPETAFARGSITLTEAIDKARQQALKAATQTEEFDEDLLDEIGLAHLAMEALGAETFPECLTAYVHRCRQFLSENATLENGSELVQPDSSLEDAQSVKRQLLHGWIRAGAVTDNDNPGADLASWSIEDREDLVSHLLDTSRTCDYRFRGPLDREFDAILTNKNELYRPYLEALHREFDLDEYGEGTNDEMGGMGE